jgi:hypothetical protein
MYEDKQIIQEQKDRIIDHYTSIMSKNDKHIFNLGPLKFCNKGKAKEFVSQWLKCFYDGYEVLEKDTTWIYPLIYNHPNHIEKLEFHNGKLYIFYDQNGKRYYNLNLCNLQQSK